MRQIKTSEIRLADGRRAILDTCEIFPGEFETMLLDLEIFPPRKNLDRAAKGRYNQHNGQP